MEARFAPPPSIPFQGNFFSFLFLSPSLSLGTGSQDMAGGHLQNELKWLKAGHSNFRPIPVDASVLERKVDPVRVLDPAMGHIMGSISVV